MFEEIVFMVGFALFSFCISRLLLKHTPEPMYKIIKILAMVGIVIHEICHIIMCLITNVRIKEIKILGKNNREKKRGRFEYFGRINIDGNKKITFLQAVAISLAPLIFSFWLFFFLWDQILLPDIHLLLFFFYIFIMASIMLSAAPSFADLICIPRAFKEDPQYSLYQILLFILSIAMVCIIVIIGQFSFFHEIMNYILIMVFYYVFKYSFRGINELYHTIQIKSKSSQIKGFNYRAFTRKRFKPRKPEKMGRKEAPW